MKNSKWDKDGTFWLFSIKNIHVVFNNMHDQDHGKIGLNAPGAISNDLEQGKLFFNEWTHFAVVRDANLLHTIYRNGELVGTVQGTSLDFERVSNSIGELGLSLIHI